MVRDERFELSPNAPKAIVLPLTPISEYEHTN